MRFEWSSANDRCGQDHPRAPGMVLATSVAFALVGGVGTALPTRYAEIHLASAASTMVLLAVAIPRLRLGVDDLRMVAAALLGAGALALASTMSRTPELSMESVSMGLGYLALFLLARRIGATPHLLRAVAIGVASAISLWLLIIAAIWVFEKLIWVIAGGGWPDLASRTTLIWGSPNVVPFLVLLGVVYIALLPPTRTSRVIKVVFLGASPVVVLLSEGRAAWLGLSVAGVLWFGTTGLQIGGRTLVPPLSVWWAAVAAASLTGVVVAIALLTGSLDSRVLIWEQALRLFGTDMMTGAGPNTFSWARLTVLEPFAVDVVTEHAHNFVLQTLADGGLVLLATSLALAATYSAAVFARRRKLIATQRLALCVVVGFAASALLDHLVAFNAIVAMAVFLAGFILARQESEPAESRPHFSWPIAYACVTAVLLTVSAPSVIGNGLARLEAQAARSLALAGDAAGAAQGFDRALQWMPTNAAYHLGSGLAKFLLAEEEAATAHLQTAADLSPGDPRPHAMLAQLRSGDPRLRSLRRAAELSAGRAEYVAQYAVELERRREYGRAVEVLAVAAIMQPDSIGPIAGLPMGIETSELRRATSLPQTRRYAASIRRDYALVDREFDLAIDALPPAAAPAWQAVWHIGRGNTEQAYAHLERARDLSPHDPSTWAAHEAVGQIACDTSLARWGSLMRLLLTERGRIGALNWDPLYREQGLGDYQWPWPSLLSASGPSPLWAVDNYARECGGTTWAVTSHPRSSAR